MAQWVVIVPHGCFTTCYGIFPSHDASMVWVRANQFSVEDVQVFPVCHDEPEAGRPAAAGDQMIPIPREDLPRNPFTVLTDPPQLPAEAPGAGDPVRQLVEQWRAEADRGAANAKRALAKGLKYTAVMSAGMATALREKANELDAALRGGSPEGR